MGNIRRLTVHQFWSKGTSLVKFLQANQCDGAALQELGLHWGAMDPLKHFSALFRHCFPAKTRACHNAQVPPTSPLQYGGTAVALMSQALPRFHSFSSDPSGLGRWTSVCISGREGHHCRLVSIYSPQDAVGLSHRDYLKSQGRLTTPPTEALQEDFLPILLDWVAANETILIGIDANEDTRSGSWHTLFVNAGLHHIIQSSTHGSKSPLPSTHNRNTTGTPIDAIFTNLPTTDAIQCGYFGFENGFPKTDHRTPMWIDVPFSLALGYNPPDLHRFQIPNLKPFDPAIRKSYIHRVHTLFNHYRIPDQVKSLREATAAGDVSQAKSLHQNISALATKLWKTAALHLFKKKAGQQKYSPRLQLLRDTKILWTHVVNRKLGCKVSSSLIRRLCCKTRISCPSRCSLLQATLNRQKAQSNFLAGLKEAPNWRQTAMQALANQIAKEQDKDPASVLKQLTSQEHQRDQWNRIRIMRKKIRGGEILQALQVYHLSCPRS